MTSELTAILKGLAEGAIFASVNHLKGPISSREVRVESEASIERILSDLRVTLERQGLDPAEIMQRKRRSLEAWKRNREVFLEQLREPGSEMFRYNEGARGAEGYIIMRAGKPKYWLAKL